MSLVLHLSDPHFGTERTHVADALLRLSARQGPDLVIVSGDVTQRARRVEFAAAAAFVACLATPTLVLPGNHDIALFNLASRLFTPYANYRHAFGRELSPVVDSDELLVIGVNTTRFWRHKDGEVSARQIAEVAARLRSAQAAQLRIVVTHQPVHVITKRDEANLLRGHNEAIRAWSAAGADLILGGHIHLPYVRDLRQTYADLPRATWVVQAGTAVSSRVRFKTANSVNLIRYTAETRRYQVERWDFDDASAEFMRAGEWALQADRS